MSQKKIRLAVDLTVEPNNADLDALKKRLLGVMATARADGTLTADLAAEIVDYNAVCVEYG